MGESRMKTVGCLLMFDLSITEHGELVLHRKPMYRSMIISPQMTNTNGSLHMMENSDVSTEVVHQLSRKNSVNSLDSTESVSQKCKSLC